MSIRVSARERNVITHQGIDEKKPKTHIKVMGSWVPLKLRDIIQGTYESFRPATGRKHEGAPLPLSQRDVIAHVGTGKEVLRSVTGRKHEGTPPPISQRNVIAHVGTEREVLRLSIGRKHEGAPLPLSQRDVIAHVGTEREVLRSATGRKHEGAPLPLSQRDVIAHVGTEKEVLRLKGKYICPLPDRNSNHNTSIGKRTFGNSSSPRDVITHFGVEEKDGIKFLGKRTQGFTVSQRNPILGQ